MAASPKYIVIDARISGTSTGRYSENLVKYLAKIDKQNNYLVLVNRDYLINAPKLVGSWAYMVADYPITGSLSEQTKLLRDINGLEPDLVHFTMVQQPIFYRGNSVTTVHDLTTLRFRNPSRNILLYKFKQILYRWFIRITIDKSTTVIVPSEYVKEDLSHLTGQPLKKFNVTYEAADKIKSKADPYKKLTGKKFLMYVGRPFPHKNLDRLIEAFEILQVKYPDLYLVLAGKKDSNYEQTEKRVKDKDSKNIIFTGFVSEGQLRWLYENCQAYVFPSLSEGFGLAGVEAMVHGAPVVSSNTSCLPEIYGDGAQYFDPLDIDDMVNVIAKVLRDEELRKQMVKNGHKQAAKYSWQRMAEQTLDVYKRALES